MTANIAIVNSGPRDAEDDGLEGSAFYADCNRWLTSDEQIQSHVGDDGGGDCYANASGEATYPALHCRQP